VQKIHSAIDMLVAACRVPRSSNVVHHSKPAWPNEVKNVLEAVIVETVTSFPS